MMVSMKNLHQKPFEQYRRPTGPLGRAIVDSMNRSHYRVTGWGLSQASFSPADRVVDLGCGGGRTMARLLKRVPRGGVTGVDYSADCVRWASERNRTAVARGRARVVQADVSSLPFGDAEFDWATAVETVYFWPDPAACFREVRRVLKPGGKFLLVNELYADESTRERDAQLKETGGMRVLSPEQAERLLREAGFSEVELFLQKERNWMCCRAVR